MISKFWKFSAFNLEFQSFSRSLEHFFLIVGQNNFVNKIPCFLKSRLHDHMTFIFRPLFVKLSFLIIIQSDLILMGHEKKLFFEANVASSHFWILCTLGLNKLWRSILIYFDCIPLQFYKVWRIHIYNDKYMQRWKKNLVKTQVNKKEVAPSKINSSQRGFKRENWGWPPIYHLVCTKILF